MSITEIINTAWPILLGFITLVIVLAKMHTSIEVLQEKVKALFDLHNKKQINRYTISHGYKVTHGT